MKVRKPGHGAVEGFIIVPGKLPADVQAYIGLHLSRKTSDCSVTDLRWKMFRLIIQLAVILGSFHECRGPNIGPICYNSCYGDPPHSGV